MDYIKFYTRHGVKELKKAGRQYLGFCPMHDDKEPSFLLDPKNGLWNCFGACKRGGNTITFCRSKGIDIKESPDHDSHYSIYRYRGGAEKWKLKDKRDEGRSLVFWKGPDDSKGREPFNPGAIDLAKEMKKTLWICEGEKDTVTMLESGELAVGIPSTSAYRVLDGISLNDIPEVVIAMDNDDAGRTVMESLKDMFPFAKVIVWPSHYRDNWDVTDSKTQDRLDADEDFITQLRKFIRKDTWQDEGELLDDFWKETVRGTSYIKTGFSEFDKRLDGLIPGALHVIQASSSVGKTTFCKQLADQIHVKAPDLPIFFFALEDSLRTVRSMTLSRLTHDLSGSKDWKIENRLIRKGGDSLSHHQLDYLKKTIGPKAKEIYGEDYLLIAGEPDINVEKIRDKVKHRLAMIQKSSAVVIVDYLQILPAPKSKRFSSLMERVDFNLHEFQCLARDINGPVILTSSTTKGDIKGDGAKTPGLVKENVSANVFFIPRMLFELIETNREDKYVDVELHVLKHSEGEKGFGIPFRYYPKYSKFEEWEKMETESAGGLTS
jgi:KaiC/GvpD/RAD55 family RecA-like ATPase